MTSSARVSRWAIAPLIAALMACSGSTTIDDGMPAPMPTDATITDMTPPHGPQGTDVRIQAAGFPANASVNIGFGPPDSEYTILKTVRTNATGWLSTTATVPSWADANRSYVFVVADTDNAPKAISRTFHVTDGSTGMLRLEGRITSEGVECLAMRGSDGNLYTLAGKTSGFEPGDRVVVEGTIADVSTCMQGTTINVKTIKQTS